MEDPILLEHLEAWHKVVSCMDPVSKERAMLSIDTQIRVIRFAHEMEISVREPRVKTVNNPSRGHMDNVIVPMPFQGVEVIIPIFLKSSTHSFQVSHTHSIGIVHGSNPPRPPYNYWNIKGMGYIPSEMHAFLTDRFSDKIGQMIEGFNAKMDFARRNLDYTLRVYHERNDRTLRKHAKQRMLTYIEKCNMQDESIDVLMAVIRACKENAGNFEAFAKYLASNVQDLHLLSQEEIEEAQHQVVISKVNKD